MSLVAINNCTHSCTAHLFEHPLCEEQSLVQRIMNVVFHILTLCIPLVIYHIISCCFPEVSVVSLYEDPAPPQNGICLFQPTKLGNDPIINIAMFLSFKERLILGKTARVFKTLIQHDYLMHFSFNETLKSHNISLIEFNESLSDRMEKWSALIQLTILDKFELPWEFQFFAEHIKGGVLAYMRIPNLDLSTIPSFILPANKEVPINGVKPEHMSASIMKGKDGFGRHFLAICLFDKVRQDAKPTVLVLVADGCKEWNQAANDYWQQNQIRVGHRNAILSILNGEVQEHNLPGVSNCVELYRPEEEKKDT